MNALQNTLSVVDIMLQSLKYRKFYLKRGINSFRVGFIFLWYAIKGVK